MVAGFPDCLKTSEIAVSYETVAPRRLDATAGLGSISMSGLVSASQVCIDQLFYLFPPSGVLS